MLIELLFGIAGTFVLSAIHGGLAFAAAIGFLLIGAWAYFGLPVGAAGLVIFATAAALFVLTGGVR